MDKALNQIDLILMAAATEGHDTTEILLRALAKNLMSETDDPCHIEGISFVAKLDKLLIEESKRGN